MRIIGIGKKLALAHGVKLVCANILQTITKLILQSCVFGKASMVKKVLLKGGTYIHNVKSVDCEIGM